MNNLLDIDEVLEPCKSRKHCWTPEWFIKKFKNKELTQKEKEDIQFYTTECDECYTKLRAALDTIK